MIKVVAVDDEPISLKVIENFCNRINTIQLEKAFDKPKEAHKFLNKFPVDLLLLDINMPELNGIEFYKSLKQTTLVIFTTSSVKHAVEGFNLNAIDYLLKPFTFVRFEQSIQKAIDYINYQANKSAVNEQFLYVRADYSLIKINLSDIIYIEGLDDYLKIHTVSQRIIVARLTMKGIIEKLPAKDFIRIHRSYIVPFMRIEKVKNKRVVIGNVELPIGKSFEENFFNLFK